jgi:hypothetical protein
VQLGHAFIQVHPHLSLDSKYGLQHLRSSVPTPLYVWEMLGARLRVDEKVQKSVVFVGTETENGFLPCGTALLGLAIYEDMGHALAITARHVLDDITGDVISFRVNRQDGGASIVKTKKSLAIVFNKRAVDLAVLPIAIDSVVHDTYLIPLQSAAWQQQIEALGEPGLGDEVCVAGLYTTHYGHTRNIPIVRIGHIAAMPEEPVMTDRGFVVGYLIECHSIAGLSGSPVYWNVPQLRVINNEIHKLEHPTHLPLGILIGHHVIESKEDEIVVPQFQQSPETREYVAEQSSPLVERRTGFALVLPIQFIFEIFESDKMKKILKNGVEEVRRRSGYRPASAASPLKIDLPEGDANPQHREDFKRMLRNAAKPPKSD